MFNTSRIRLIFVVIAFSFVAAILIYSQFIVRELRRDAQKSLTFYTSLYARLAGDEQVTDFSFVFDEMISKIGFPIIITVQPETEVTAWKNIPSVPNNVQYNDETLKLLERDVREMDRYVTPIPLMYRDIVLGYIHYGDSLTITRLKWMPYIEVIGIVLLLIFGLVALEYVRSSEKKFIWVGMAKETAHQLGTPISSLLGWLELSKAQFGEDNEAFIEMDRDIKRLEKVSHRFSQIGSKVQRKPLDLLQVMQNVEAYMSRRLPQKNSTVDLKFINDIMGDFRIKGNADLLEWALENLIKNGVDALEGGSGVVMVRFSSAKHGQVIIEVSDTGKGIPEKQWRTVFQPGFSTKKRGWGLGLSLTRRIIEEYHAGQIYVAHSQPGQGTTFRVVLK